MVVRQDDCDEWEHTEGGVVRNHARPRRALFTPLRVKGSPPAKVLTSMRVTEGCYVESGERFKVVDQWTARATAHAAMKGFWVGTTRFWTKSA